jgi:hypothetical protein
MEQPPREREQEADCRDEDGSKAIAGGRPKWPRNRTDRRNLFCGFVDGAEPVDAERYRYEADDANKEAYDERHTQQSCRRYACSG